jgi:hypothetical protein
MPPARLKEIVPAFRARKRCNLRLSSIAASVDTRHPRDCREVCLLAKRQTETADDIVGLPIYRAVKLIIKRRVNAQDFANHDARWSKGLILWSFFCCTRSCTPAKEGCSPPVAMHDAPTNDL